MQVIFVHDTNYVNSTISTVIILSITASTINVNNIIIVTNINSSTTNGIIIIIIIIIIINSIDVTVLNIINISSNY